jgi:hypothetical protein
MPTRYFELPVAVCRILDDEARIRGTSTAQILIRAISQYGAAAERLRDSPDQSVYMDFVARLSEMFDFDEPEPEDDEDLIVRLEQLLSHIHLRLRHAGERVIFPTQAEMPETPNGPRTSVWDRLRKPVV